MQNIIQVLFAFKCYVVINLVTFKSSIMIIVKKSTLFLALLFLTIGAFAQIPPLPSTDVVTNESTVDQDILPSDNNRNLGDCDWANEPITFYNNALPNNYDSGGQRVACDIAVPPDTMMVINSAVLRVNLADGAKITEVFVRILGNKTTFVPTAPDKVPDENNVIREEFQVDVIDQSFLFDNPINSSQDVFDLALDFSDAEIELVGDSLETTYYWFAIAFRTDGGDSQLASWAYTGENGKLGIEGFSFKETPDAQIWFRGFFETEVVYDFDVDCFPMTVSSTKDDFRLEGVSIAPNPAQDRLRIIGESTLDRVTIYNLLGQEELSVMPNTSVTLLEIEKLTHGTYVVLVESGGKLGSYKIFKGN